MHITLKLSLRSPQPQNNFRCYLSICILCALCTSILILRDNLSKIYICVKDRNTLILKTIDTPFQIHIHQDFLSRTVSFFMLKQAQRFGMTERIQLKRYQMNSKAHTSFKAIRKDIRTRLILSRFGMKQQFTLEYRNIGIQK